MSEGELCIDDDERRVVDLVRQLCEIEMELQKLTGGQLDAVAGADGKTYLLSEAQDNLRASERAQRTAAENLTAILDALPAHIALLDPEGVILKVNRSWKTFATSNALQGPSYCVGQNYLEVCGGGKLVQGRRGRQPTVFVPCWEEKWRSLSWNMHVMHRKKIVGLA